MVTNWESRAKVNILLRELRVIQWTWKRLSLQLVDGTKAGRDAAGMVGAARRTLRAWVRVGEKEE